MLLAIPALAESSATCSRWIPYALSPGICRSLSKLLQPSYPLLCGARAISCNKSGDMIESRQDFRMRIPLTQGAPVYFHRIRQQRRANGSMRRVKHAADRRGKSMHRTQPRIRQGQTTEQTRQCQVFPGLLSPPCTARRNARAARGIPSRQSASVSGFDSIGKIRLQKLGQCVQPGKGRELRRQMISQLGVNNRHPRQHQRTA